MSKIYFRGGMSPLETFSPGYILNNNVLGSNVGNFLYLHGVLRALTLDEDTVLQANYYNTNRISPEEVNEKYDYFIIPLADAFRENFQDELNELTAFVEKLTIPCVVTGVGLRASYEPNFAQGFPFDESVKCFVKAVLEKSSCVGIRGELTGEYLKHLGFKEDSDYMVIGCPSMYSFGSHIVIKEPELKKDSLICFNSNIVASEKIKNYINMTMSEYPNAYFIGQVVRELRTLYVGAPYAAKKEYPIGRCCDQIYQEGRLRFFVNVSTWLDFMRKADFSFGSRLHGNISATLAGTPSILITKDARTRELAEYHHLNCISEQDLANDLSLPELIEKQDFGQIQRYQKENFERFVRFLDMNRLQHIYKGGNEPLVSPLENAMAKVNHVQGIVPLSQCSIEEIAARYDDYYKFLDKKVNGNRKKIRNQQNEIRNLNKQNAVLEREKNSSFLRKLFHK